MSASTVRRPTVDAAAGPAGSSRVARVAVAVAVAGLVSNILIVLTGALVRLTGSGLGCPTWPRCTDASFVNTPEMGVHGVIEFGNRLLGIGVGLVTLAMLVATVRVAGRRRSATWLAVGALVGVAVQGVVGGISVRVALAPEVVGVHFLLSMVIVAAVTVLVDVLRRPRVAPIWRRPAEVRWVVAALVPSLALVLVLGTLVTGSGPHAGDEGAARLGIDPATISWLHADSVILFLGLQLATLVALRLAGADRRTVRAAELLVAASLAQGGVGYLQYALDLPVPLVAVHVLGAAIVTWATTRLVVRVVRGDTDATPAHRSAPEMVTGSESS